MYTVVKIVISRIFLWVALRYMQNVMAEWCVQADKSSDIFQSGFLEPSTVKQKTFCLQDKS